MLNMSGAITTVKGSGMLNMSGTVTNIGGAATLMMGAPALVSSGHVIDGFGKIGAGFMASVVNTLNALPSAVLGQLQGLAGFDMSQLSNMVGGQLSDFMGSMDGMLGALPDLGSIMMV
jgi:hypothetical protein